jgi:hypothetical protein
MKFYTITYTYDGQTFTVARRGIDADAAKATFLAELQGFSKRITIATVKPPKRKRPPVDSF